MVYLIFKYHMGYVLRYAMSLTFVFVVYFRINFILKGYAMPYAYFIPT